MTKKILTKFLKIDQQLAVLYGENKFAGGLDPLTELVKTVLSQNTSDTNRDRAFAELKSTFPKWDDIVKAPVNKIASSIKVAGLANTRASRIRNLLKAVYKLQGEYNLSRLADWPDDQIKQYLLNIEGVGPKTAACVMAFSFGRNIMPVDTHVYRVSQRLGLMPVKTSVAAAHEYYTGFKDSLSLYQLHLNMIAHGRNVCHARKPRCVDCSLKRMCDYYQKNLVSSARNNQ